ncbi:hypothetical protein NP493_7g02046 [Ridgeia piscesae]|uniref:Phorbol-ester/DAG-type domain-containing protein n=1 Tax=Ridgeia piscesae TaxID=27915 RepID=A0AAD9PF90_RIDPI|nr:hypothetical protein NP493_7g02046 [Ridgeia piscesae]
MKAPLTQLAWETKQRLETSPQLLSDYASQMALVYLTATVFGFIVSFLVAKLYRRLRQPHYEIPARDVSKGHRWCITDIFPQPTYCNVSGKHIIHGVFCDSCGICVEEHLAVEANRTLLCKSLATHTENRRHHWIKGNLPLCSVCDVCHTDCGNRPGLGDLRCCWCNRTIHDKCVDNLSAVCDLGTYRNSIIPPSCVKLKLVGFKGRRHYVVDCVRRPNIPNWNPLIVLANRKSGNGNSEIVLQAFRRLLNPVQVSTNTSFTRYPGNTPFIDCLVMLRLVR